MVLPRSDLHDQPALSRLVVAIPGSGRPEQVARVLMPGATGWLGELVDGPVPDGMRRHLTDLRLRVSEHPSLTTFRKAALVDLGAVHQLHESWQVEIGWRAATLAPLFPVFAGELMIRPGELTVSGYYAPPGGQIGLIADRVLLNIAARGTARWLLQQIHDAALDGDTG